MRKFIISFILFLAPVFLLSYFTDRFISANLKKSTTYTGGEYTVWNDILEGNVNSEILIYGSSRAWVHIDPNLLSDQLGKTAYNVGIDGHNFWLQYLRHLLVLKSNVKPKYIIVSLDIFTLEKVRELYNADQFLPYMYNEPLFEEYLKSYVGFTWIDFHMPLMRYRGRSSSMLHACKLYMEGTLQEAGRVNGYQGMNKEWNSDLENALKKVGHYEIKIDTPSLKLFQEFIEGCQKDHIALLFVYSPEYVEGQKFVKNRKDIMDLYTALSTTYSIPFYDFSNDSISYDKAKFYNASHLNMEGSRDFTIKLADQIIANGWMNAYIE
ncbi:MAG: hypothetical protein WAT37_18110 [Saprospiraceae bacterium]